MINISELINVIFYILLIVLVVTLIVLVINAIKTLTKLDRLIDDVSYKLNQLNGAFNIIDGATSAVGTFSDSIVSTVTSALTKIFKRKKDKNE